MLVSTVVDGEGGAGPRLSVVILVDRVLQRTTARGALLCSLTMLAVMVRAAALARQSVRWRSICSYPAFSIKRRETVRSRQPESLSVSVHARQQLDETTSDLYLFLESDEMVKGCATSLRVMLP